MLTSLSTVILFAVSCFGQYDPQRVGKGRSSGSFLPAGSLKVRQPIGNPYGSSRPFVYNHVAKTGGSFVKNVLIGLFGRDNITILEEWQGSGALHIPENQTERPFVMGAIRAPCDYYLSLWAFASGGTVDKVLRTVPEIREYMGQDYEVGFYTDADIARFRKWMEGLSSENLNLLTARFWFSYFKEGNPCRPKEGDVCAGKESYFEDLKSEIDEDLSKAELPDIANCWLRTEHLEQDFAACLKQYGEEAGVEIDWELFRDLMKHKEKNKSERRGTCDEFYDDNTRKLVETKDAHVVRIFGYDTCCAPPRHKEEERVEEKEKVVDYSYYEYYEEKKEL